MRVDPIEVAGDVPHENMHLRDWMLPMGRNAVRVSTVDTALSIQDMTSIVCAREGSVLMPS